MTQLPDELSLIIGLILLALIPFIAVMATSFVKMAMVFSLLRNALGVQQIPPNMAIYGLSIILTLYIMAPVALATKDFLNENPVSLSASSSLEYFFDEGTKPYKSFLTKHINQREKEFFSDNIAKLWPPKYVHSVSSDSLFILLPAFTISELTRAFEIGFLLYLPFIIAIDLIVSNILLAMGMMMVSPMTISLPFKLLLFVMFDGWSRLNHGLILNYSG